MPELPEVETVVQTLKKMILNDKIVDCEVMWNNIISKIEVSDFIHKVKNQSILDITRQGKIIMFVLDDYILLSHLRMEGKYFIDNEYVKDKHSHVIFKLLSNRYLRYHDTRKFGKLSLIKKEDYLTHPFLINLGKEPFDISVDDLYDKLSHKNIEIKPALLDQRVMSGLGNIYVDEVLFRSNIHPETKSNMISKKQVQSIIDNSIVVLNKAINLGGTTIRSYTSSLGVHGKFQNELMVHTRANERCFECNTNIEKIKVKGRGTYLCPTCQKK